MCSFLTYHSFWCGDDFARCTEILSWSHIGTITKRFFNGLSYFAHCLHERTLFHTGAPFQIWCWSFTTFVHRISSRQLWNTEMFLGLKTVSARWCIFWRTITLFSCNRRAATKCISLNRRNGILIVPVELNSPLVSSVC